MRRVRLNPISRGHLAWHTGLAGIDVGTHSNGVYGGKGGSTIRQIDAVRPIRPSRRFRCRSRSWGFQDIPRGATICRTTGRWN